HIPENYTKLFGNGTKPADWTDDVPSVDTLSEQLSEQLDRMKEIPVEQLDEKLDQPILGQNTFGELACMSVFHEANHLGQIHAMQYTAKAEKEYVYQLTVSPGKPITLGFFVHLV